MRQQISGVWRRLGSVPVRWRWAFGGVAALLLLGMAAVLLLAGEAPAQPPPLGERANGVVEKIDDGDTITVRVGTHRYTVQYAGIIAPEKQRPYGKAAARANAILVKKQTVEFERDITDTDERGRFVRYVWVEGELVNEILVREGYALADPHSPDTKYRVWLMEAQEEARAAKLGIASLLRGPLNGTDAELPPTTRTPSPTPTRSPTRLPPSSLPPTAWFVARPTFIVNLEPMDCHQGPDADTPVVFVREAGTVQAVDAYVEQLDGTWYREVDRQCWTWTEPGLVQTFDKLTDAVRYARGLRQTPTATPTRTPRPLPPPSTPAPRGECDLAYPTVCIPPPPPVLQCRDVLHRDFRVLPPDPHGLDGDQDGIACESAR